MTIVVVGPGAIGLDAAQRLSQSGHAVVVGCRSAARAKSLAKLHPELKFVSKPPESSLTILTPRGPEALSALKSWGKQGLVVGVQNGWVGESLAKQLGERYIPAVIGYPVTLDTHAHRTGDGPILLGAWPHGALTRAVRDQLEPLRAVAPLVFHDDMQGVQWSKIMVNSCINGLAVLTGKQLAHIVHIKAARGAFYAILREAHAVAKVAGIQLHKVGAFRPWIFVGKRSRLFRPVHRRILKAIGRRYGSVAPSSLQALHRGAPLELDAINGAIVALGIRHGVPTPVNSRLMERVAAIEKGAEPGLEQLDGLVSLDSPNP